MKIKELNLRRDKLFLSVFAIFFSIYFSFSITFFSASAQSVREAVVRLHILANSDSDKDQAVKLKVRDALLKTNTKLLKSGVTKENAEIYFENSKKELLKTAETVLKENGFSYGAEIILTQEYYETRTYGSLIFPAGEYLSLRVILGDGEGKNWWCVMFPPMCVPAASEVTADDETAAEYLSENGEKIVSGGNKYIVKFKIIELYEELKARFK